MAHAHTFMRESIFEGQTGRYVHNNPEVFGLLRKWNPDAVVTTGFTPTHLYSFAYTRLFRRKHIAMTDSTVRSEAAMSTLRQFLRRRVIRGSGAYIAASVSGQSLLVSYGAAVERITLSPLCANSTVQWDHVVPARLDLDFLFSGRLIDVKNPQFALQVARESAKRLGRRTTLAILGDGPLRDSLRVAAAEASNEVEVHFAGNVSQTDVPRWFASARIFLFPSAWDPWGVVANEACLAGVPTIISPLAGAAGELIVDNETGLVRELELAQWVDAACELISNDALYKKIARQAEQRVRPYNFERAAAGILDAAWIAVAGVAISRSPEYK